MIRYVPVGIAVVAAWNGVVEAQPKDQPARARARLIAERPALVPGATAWLGVAFDIDKEWHLYWNGSNDTGFPIKLTPTLPEGYVLSKVLWPAPMRHLTEHFLDHVYEERVTLLLPLQVPATAKPGEKVTINVEAAWLVCKEACLPGEAMMTLTLPVASEAPPPSANADSKRFAEARANLPGPLDKTKPELRIEWESDSVAIRTADHAEGLAFYPSLDSAAFADLATQGVSKSDTLKLQFEKPGAGDRLVGVVEIGPGGRGPRRLFSIDSARPNREQPGASNSNQPSGG
jgi:DsbC/DsbD-like thiol-disulfide interchange protein